MYWLGTAGDAADLLGMPCIAVAETMVMIGMQTEQHCWKPTILHMRQQHSNMMHMEYTYVVYMCLDTYVSALNITMCTLS